MDTRHRATLFHAIRPLCITHSRPSLSTASGVQQMKSRKILALARKPIANCEEPALERLCEWSCSVVI